MVLLTALAVVFACGCTKTDDPNNGGGGGNSGGGNGGGNSGGNGTYNGHAYVDLGLPSGTLWATCNVGADTPEGYGDYFAWGETAPKTTYDWDTYKYCNGAPRQLTKYCVQPEYGYNGFTDSLTLLQPQDDAATANWGDGWCIPYPEQWEELWYNTVFEQSIQNGVKGILFTATNGRSLFLPAAGGISGTSHLFPPITSNYYWSNSLECYSGWQFRAECLCFENDYINIESTYRCKGRSVRPVRSLIKQHD